MAFNFNSFLRRASASILPLEIGSAAGVISAVSNVGNRQLIGSQFLPFSRFSTAMDCHIVRIIDPTYKAQKASSVIPMATELCEHQTASKRPATRDGLKITNYKSYLYYNQL